MVEKIGRSLADQLGARPPKAFDDGPVERVGAILNASPADTRDEVLGGLETDDLPFATAVRKAIFTFADIPDRLDPKDIPKVTKDIDQTVLITALTYAAEDLDSVAEFILGAMSKRLAEQLREEISERGKVKTKDGDAAMSAVIANIRELETAGEITLITEDDE